MWIHMVFDFDSGSFKPTAPPTNSTAEVIRIGYALLTSIKFPNVTLPRMAATRPRQLRKPKAVALE